MPPERAKTELLRNVRIWEQMKEKWYADNAQWLDPQHHPPRKRIVADIDWAGHATDEEKSEFLKWHGTFGFEQYGGVPTPDLDNQIQFCVYCADGHTCERCLVEQIERT